VADSDVAALALGGQARWFRGNSWFALGGYVFFAPKVVTFLDGTKFYDAGVRAEVEVIRNSFVYGAGAGRAPTWTTAPSPMSTKAASPDYSVKF